MTNAKAADLIRAYEARIAGLERLVGKQALELEFLKGGSAKRTSAEKRAYIRDHRPRGLSVAKGCRLMGIAGGQRDADPSGSVPEPEALGGGSRWAPGA